MGRGLNFQVNAEVDHGLYGDAGNAGFGICNARVMLMIEELDGC